MEFKVSVTQKGKIFEGKSQTIIDDYLTQAMYEATAYLEREIKRITPQGVGGALERTPQGVGGAKGGLMATIHGEVQGKGTPVIKGIVGHSSKYGDVIEKGRTAGKAWPPEGSLIRWIEVKMGVSEHEAKRIEFLIRRKIGKKGFPGAHMFEHTLTDTWPKIQNIFDRCGFAIARELSE